MFSYDFLHNWPLGVLKQVLAGIKEYVDTVNGRGTHALKVLDARLALVPRFEGLTLPAWGEYFTKAAKLTAKEHLAVEQVGWHSAHRARSSFGWLSNQHAPRCPCCHVSGAAAAGARPGGRTTARQGPHKADVPGVRRQHAHLHPQPA